MILQTLYISIFLGFTFFHSSCALVQVELEAYTAATVEAFNAVYDAQQISEDAKEYLREHLDITEKMLTTFDAQVNSEDAMKYLTEHKNVIEKMPLILSAAIKDNVKLPWKIDKLFEQPQPLTKMMKLYRLIKESEAALTTLTQFRFNPKIDEKALWDTKIDTEQNTVMDTVNDTQKFTEKSIVVIVGYDDNGFYGGYIALQLYKMGYDVFVIGMPKPDASYTGHPEFDYIRRQLMLKDLDYEAAKTKNEKLKNMFSYIEIYDCSFFQNIEKHDQFNKEDLFIVGYKGTWPNPQSNRHFENGLMIFLNNMKRKGVKTITIGNEMDTDQTNSINRYNEDFSYKLLFHIPKGTILINFVRPYILMKRMNYSWNVDTRTMVEKITGQRLQTLDVTFAVAIFDEVYTFIENLSQDTKDTIIQECKAEYTEDLDSLIPGMDIERRTNIIKLIETDITDHAVSKPNYKKNMPFHKDVMYLNFTTKYKQVPKPVYMYL